MPAGSVEGLVSPDDFDSFFHSLHGYPPFAWQSRLARQVASQGRWPRIVNLPTSAGKTATIDIAVFTLAVQAGQEKRTAPLRTYFVIDRRIVVDEAAQRAEKISAKLLEALNGPSGVCREVAQRLLSLGGDTQLHGETPLHVARLRGGIYRDAVWARSPVQPVVCVSTVDQVGSRLLFRGYGVSEYQRAIHAALVGNDSLIILDEAHLSQPFVETLKAVERYRGVGWAELPPASPFHVVRMSATTATSEESFTLHPNERQDPELRRRLDARKPARLVEVSDESDDEPANQTTFAKRIATEARALAGLEQVTAASNRRRRIETTLESAEPASIVGVVVNRVALARSVFDILREKTDECHAILLTGRIRPFDRDELLYRCPVHDGLGWFRFMEAAEDRPVLDLPLFVVATQTVEVGANISFDALITEAAPLDSLRQRYGRLDRLGLRGVSPGVILARKSAIAARAVDPVYGGSVASTWKWLNQQAGRGKKRIVDFGLNSLKVPEDAETLCAPQAHAPVLLPAHVDTLVQTSPTASPDLDLNLFLHGPESGPADVQIVWRGDLPEILQQHMEDDVISTVAVVPPTSMEALSVPVWAARSWLTNRGGASNLTDVEGDAPSSVAVEHRDIPRPFLRWRGPEDSELVVPRDDDDLDARLRPGDTIVVPSSYGGTDDFGWNPNGEDRVRDVGDACSYYARRLPVLRMHPGALSGWAPGLPERIRSALSEGEDDGEFDVEALVNLVRLNATAPWATEAAAWLSDKMRRRPTIEYPECSGPGIAIISKKRITKDEALRSAKLDQESDEGDFTAQDDTASLTGQVGLRTHCEDVRELAYRFAGLLGLGASIRDDLRAASWFHDVGKADPRFQAWLRGGDCLLADAATELLAKSGMNPRNRTAIRIARERAGYPAGGRHEFLSVAMVAHNGDALQTTNDADFVLYIIGTHHGRGRPFVPVVEDTEPVVARLMHDTVTLEGVSNHGLEQLDHGWVERFWLMQRRYGYWGLALHEAVLQLADHRCSEQAERRSHE
jgi:CRISPR-associated endonuclease/helicase Cas3